MPRQKKILIICPYPYNQAPSQRLKYEQYLDYFRQHHYEITIAPFMNLSLWKIVYQKGYFFQKLWYSLTAYLRRFILLFSLPKYDIIYLHLWGTPLGPPLYEWFIVLLARKIIYDIDDMVFLGRSSDSNAFIRTLKGKQKITYLMKKAHAIIASTSSLYDFARFYNTNVFKIPCTIDTQKFVYHYNVEDTETFIIGWIGSHSTSYYLKDIENVFEKLLEQSIRFKVLVVGDPSFSFTNPSIPTEVYRWTEEKEIEFLRKMHIGLYPLRNEPWVLGKSGGKLRQYMAVGIPTLASDTPPNREIIQHGKNGFLIPFDHPQKWVEYILLLKNNPTLRHSISKEARKTIEKQFSVQAYQHTYLSIVNQMTNHP